MGRKHGRGPAAARLRLTPLEDRTLPASGVTASLADGILRLTDYKPADTLAVQQTPAGVAVTAIDTNLSYTGVSRVVVDVLYDARVTNDVSGLNGTTAARSVYLSRRDPTGTTFASAGTLAPGATSEPPATQPPPTAPPPTQTPPPPSVPGVSAGVSNGVLRLTAYAAADPVVIGQTATGVTVTAANATAVYAGVTRVIADVRYEVRVTNDVTGLGTTAPRSVYVSRRDPTGATFISAGNLAPGATAYPPGTAPTPTPTPTPTTGDWFDRALNDAAFRSSARAVAADGAIDRIDMLRLFDKVASDGLVSGAEVHDLKALESPDWTAGGALPNQAKFTMPAPVRGLTGNVVNGDPANATYQGTPLGNLQAGAPAVQLQKLVLKWFLGTDRPVAASGTTYSQTNGALFVNGPAVDDVRQGRLSDCYFLAALGELAHDRPQAIRDMFSDNGDGTLTVRFFRNGVAEYVTVDRMLPTDSTGRLVYAGIGATASSPSNELWTVLAEKAYAQLNQSAWIEQDGTNRYAGIADGYSDLVMMHVTGGTAVFTGIIRATSAQLQQSVTAGKPTVLNSRSSPGNGVVANHTYPVVGYDSATQKFNLYNPLGGYIQLTWTQVTQSFSGFWQLQ